MLYANTFWNVQGQQKSANLLGNEYTAAINREEKSHNSLL